LSNINIHRAKWVLPIVQPPIENGAVAVANGKIVRVGTYDNLKEKGIQGKTIDHGEGVLMPALVNAHTHLELSALTGLKADNFVAWLKQVIEGKFSLHETIRKSAERLSYQILKQTGTGLIGNIKNSPEAAPASEVKEVSFFEFLGFNKETAIKRWPIWEEYLKKHPEALPAAHAPYSVHPAFLQKIKQIADERKQIFSIHIAESEAEVEFLLSGRGPLYDLLTEKGFWAEDFTPPQRRPIAYLASLGLLSPRTLCVHCVEVNEEDVSTLQKCGAKICLCPRSNAYLGLKDAPWPLFKKSGLLLCLGTDSLASNTDLNLFNEMVFLLEKNAFSASELLEMATWRGSLALGQGNYFGTMFPGAHADLLFIPLLNKTTLSALAETVIYTGAKGNIRWVEDGTTAG